MLIFQKKIYFSIHSLKFNHVSFLGEIVGNVNYIDMPGRVIHIKKLFDWGGWISHTGCTEQNSITRKCENDFCCVLNECL